MIYSQRPKWDLSNKVTISNGCQSQSKNNVKSLIVSKKAIAHHEPEITVCKRFSANDIMCNKMQTVGIRGCNALDIERNETMLSPMGKGMCKL